MVVVVVLVGVELVLVALAQSWRWRREKASCSTHMSQANAACSSAEIEPSYVLKALGLSDDSAARTLRIGIGRFTSPADIDYAAAALVAAHRGETVAANTAHRVPPP